MNCYYSNLIEEDKDPGVWPTTDGTDARRATKLDLLAVVMTGRELEEVRENQGASYSVSADSSTSDYFLGFGFIITRATVHPEIDGLRNAQNSNGYWLSLLAGAVRDPDQVSSNAARERDLQSITAEDIQTLAETYLDMSRALRI